MQPVSYLLKPTMIRDLAAHDILTEGQPCHCPLVDRFMKIRIILASCNQASFFGSFIP